MNVTIEVSNLIEKIVNDFTEYILDKNGNPKESVIGSVFDSRCKQKWFINSEAFTGYTVRLCLYNEIEDPATGDFAEYWEGICTHVEIRTISGELLAQSSCYGWTDFDIASEIEQALSWAGYKAA